MKNDIKDRLKIVKNKRKQIFKNNNELEKIANNMIVSETFDYQNCIPEIFFNENYSDINKFKIKPYNKIYDELKEYEMKNEMHSANLTIVVHPFYTLLRHPNFLVESNKYLKEYLEYEKSIKKIFKNRKNILLIESPDSFLKYTYKYYKQVNKLIFTEHSTGYFLNKNQKNSINFDEYKNIEIVGCYDKLCIDQVLEQFKESKIKKNYKYIFYRYGGKNGNN